MHRNTFYLYVVSTRINNKIPNMRKNLLLLIAITLSSFTAAIGQNHFTVVVGTFLNAKLSDFEAIQPYGFVYAREMGGGLYQVMIGGFEEQSDANQVRQQVAAKGYSGAFVQQKFASEGRLVPVIQIATRPVNQDYQWQQLLQAGDLYALPGKDLVKFVTGIYSSMDEAKLALPAVRNLGFSDAFVKQVNTVILHPVGDFETGGIQAPQPVAAQPPASTSQPVSSDLPLPYDATPRSYGNEQLLPKQPTAAAAGPAFNLPKPASAVSAPKLHPSVKRTSALELQKSLKSKGFYDGSLDGYYGQGTASAFEQFKLNDREFQKYLILAEHMDAPDQSAEDIELQNAIDNLLSDPEAQALVERSNHPIGKAYYAYMLFQTIGPGPEVNSLMNAAIQRAYGSKSFSEPPPFDITATYAYSNLTQIILHIHYIHSAPGMNFNIPCWIFQQHPTETTQAYATYAAFSSGDFQLKFCDQFMNWESVKALQAMAIDMNAGSDVDNQNIAAATSRRAELYLAPQPVTENEKLILEQWNTTLGMSLDGWATRDPMNARLASSFKTLYYQSYSRFEDYFLDKGFNADQARGMALMTMFTVVGYHLERFV